MAFRTKIFSSLMAVALIALSLSLTACGDDNDEPEVPETWTTSYTISVTFQQDFLDAAEITAHIANPDGTFASEAVVNKNTSWTLTGNKIPDKAGIAFTFVPKSNIDPDRVYNLGTKGTITTKSIKNGEVFMAKSSSVGSENMSVKGDRVSEYLTAKGIAMASGVNAEGEVIKVDTKDFDFGLNGVWEWLAGVLTGEN
jgi:lipoprotein